MLAHAALLTASLSFKSSSYQTLRSKVSKYRVFRVSTLGIVIMVSGRYLMYLASGRGGFCKAGVWGLWVGSSLVQGRLRGWHKGRSREAGLQLVSAKSVEHQNDYRRRLRLRRCF